MADENNKALEASESDGNKKADKKAKPEKAKKPSKGNIFPHMGKAIARFFKDFKGEIGKIVWPNARTVIKSTGVVLAAVLIIGLGIWIFDFAMSKGISVVEGLANTTTTEVTTTLPAVTTTAAAADETTTAAPETTTAPAQ